MARAVCTVGFLARLSFALVVFLFSHPLHATVRGLESEIQLPELIKALASSNLSSATRQAIKHNLAKLWKYENKGLKTTENCGDNSTGAQCVKQKKHKGPTNAYDAAVAALDDSYIAAASENGRLVCIVTGKCYQCDFHAAASFKYLMKHNPALAAQRISCRRILFNASTELLIADGRRKDLKKDAARQHALGTQGNCSYHLRCPTGALKVGITADNISGQPPALAAYRGFLANPLPETTRLAALQNSMFVLKSARTGSAWFSSMLASANDGPPTLDGKKHFSSTRPYFEAFSQVLWFQTCSSLQPVILSALVSHTNRHEDILRSMFLRVSSRPNLTSVDKPCQGLEGMLREMAASQLQDAKVTVSELKSVVLLNPRFLNSITRYDLLFEPGFPGAILNLRRSNLVKMGLSKMQHGLHVQRREVVSGFERVIIDVDLLLETILLYCIQDQEWASYVSYSSRQADVVLVIYEDVLSRPEIVLKSMQPWFSVPLRIDPADASGKIHSPDICGEEVINCDEVLLAFGDDYRCLTKQLLDTQSQTWSLPMYRDPRSNELVIDLKRGDCHALPNLQDSLADRTLEQLYTETEAATS